MTERGGRALILAKGEHTAKCHKGMEVLDRHEGTRHIEEGHLLQEAPKAAKSAHQNLSP